MSPGTQYLDGQDVADSDIQAQREARKAAKRAEKEAAHARRSEREAELAAHPPEPKPTRSTDVRDEADAELFALLLRHPGVTEALHDLTKGSLMNYTDGTALQAVNVCQRVGQWRYEHGRPKE